MLQDVGIADQQKAQKQDRDSSIKQFSTHPHPTYLERYVELCTEPFYATIPTLCLCFVLIYYPYIL